MSLTLQQIEASLWENVTPEQMRINIAKNSNTKRFFDSVAEGLLRGEFNEQGLRSFDEKLQMDRELVKTQVKVLSEWLRYWVYLVLCGPVRKNHPYETKIRMTPSGKQYDVRINTNIPAWDAGTVNPGIALNNETMNRDYVTVTQQWTEDTRNQQKLVNLGPAPRKVLKDIAKSINANDIRTKLSIYSPQTSFSTFGADRPLIDMTHGQSSLQKYEGWNGAKNISIFPEEGSEIKKYSPAELFKYFVRKPDEEGFDQSIERKETDFCLSMKDGIDVGLAKPSLRILEVYSAILNRYYFSATAPNTQKYVVRCWMITADSNKNGDENRAKYVLRGYGPVVYPWTIMVSYRPEPDSSSTVYGLVKLDDDITVKNILVGGRDVVYEGLSDFMRMQGSNINLLSGEVIARLAGSGYLIIKIRVMKESVVGSEVPFQFADYISGDVRKFKAKLKVRYQAPLNEYAFHDSISANKKIVDIGMDKDGRQMISVKLSFDVSEGFTKYLALMQEIRRRYTETFPSTFPTVAFEYRISMSVVNDTANTKLEHVLNQVNNLRASNTVVEYTAKPSAIP